MEPAVCWPGASLSEILTARARQQPRLAFRFLPDGSGDNAVDWTYQDLAVHAGVLAEKLRRDGLTGHRVMLALDPGLHYIAALFGIFAAGATAVPSFPPTGRRATDRFLSIIRDCAPDAVITDARFAGRTDVLTARLPPATTRPVWLFVEDTVAMPHGSARPGAAADRTVTDGADLPSLGAGPATPALLQYTSGSTGQPKGIVLTHANLVSNCRTLEANTGADPERVGCSWLPPYHDMGLMGTIMLALHGGWPLVMLSPAHFVQRPYRWLKAITDNKVTISVGPNFAFDLCAETVTDDELATLDLSSLRQVFCGSEPVSRATLDRFRDRFSGCGYRESVLIPCYGMAEATLFVSGRAAGSTVRTEWLDRDALEHGHARPLSAADRNAAAIVSCGVVAEGHEVVIVSPETMRPLSAGRVGEIWIHGPNVAAGYLGQPERTADTFAARLASSAPPADTSERRYLRTGDLGFLLDGELFITGRIKDVIVIAGRNLYPQDIESSVRGAHPALRRAAAFSMDDDGDTGTERLVIVAEIRGTARQAAALAAEIRDTVVAAVTADHGVRPADVQLGPVGVIPVTTSGKIRRDATRSAYRQGLLATATAGHGPGREPIPAVTGCPA